MVFSLKQRTYSAQISGGMWFRSAVSFSSFLRMNQSGSTALKNVSGNAAGCAMNGQCQPLIARVLVHRRPHVERRHDVDDRRLHHLVRMIEAHAVRGAAAAVVAGDVRTGRSRGPASPRPGPAPSRGTSSWSCPVPRAAPSCRRSRAGRRPRRGNVRPGAAPPCARRHGSAGCRAAAAAAARCRRGAGGCGRPRSRCR